MNERIQIEVGIFSIVQEVRSAFGEKSQRNRDFTGNHFKFIYENVILNEIKPLQFYQILNESEIWFGRIESYFKGDCAILNVFVTGRESDSIWLIAKRSRYDWEFRDALTRIYPNVKNIWVKSGQKYELPDIDKCINKAVDSGIISCDDPNLTFNQVAGIHDRYWLDRYMIWDRTRLAARNEATMTQLSALVNKLTAYATHQGVPAILGATGLMEMLTDSAFGFIVEFSQRICDGCNKYWQNVKYRFNAETRQAFEQYFYIAVFAAVNDNMQSGELGIAGFSQSVEGIVMAALGYCGRYCEDSNGNDWRFWARLWISRMSWTGLTNGDLDEWINEWTANNSMLLDNYQAATGESDLLRSPFDEHWTKEPDATRNVAIFSADIKGKVIMEINESNSRDDLRYLIESAIESSHQKVPKAFQIVYRNIVINGDEFLPRLCDMLDDEAELWIGDFEGLLKENDVIVELFLAGSVPSFVHFIMDSSDSIYKLKSMLADILHYPIRIWNANGQPINSMPEILATTDCKLLIQCDQLTNQSFTECCQCHNQYLVEYYLRNNDLTYMWYRREFGHSQTNQLRQALYLARKLILSNGVKDPILDYTFPQMPAAFVSCGFLFCEIMTDRICSVCIDSYWKSQMGKWLNDDIVARVFRQYFRDAL